MMATSNNESDSSRKNTDNKENDNQDEKYTMFECKICLNVASDPVVCVCGHLFCWPCLHQWMTITESHPVCPVCKADINDNEVIPIYGRSNFKQNEPRNIVPPRPSSHGTESESATGIPTYTDENVGFNLSLRLGQFPFNHPSLSDDQNETQFDAVLHPDAANFLSTFFMWTAVIYVAWIIYVA